MKEKKKELHPFDEFDLNPTVENFYKWVKSIRTPKKVLIRKVKFEYAEGTMDFSIGNRKFSDTVF